MYIIFSFTLYPFKPQKIEIISYHTATSIQTTNNYYKYFRNATTTIRQWNALFASTLSTPLLTALLLIADIHFIASVL